MNNQITIGQKVLHPDYQIGSNASLDRNTGEVVEIDEAASRARVAWPWSEWVHPTRHAYGQCSDQCHFEPRIRRTWIKVSRLRPAVKAEAK